MSYILKILAKNGVSSLQFCLHLKCLCKLQPEFENQEKLHTNSEPMLT